MKRFTTVKTITWFIAIFIAWNVTAYFLFGRTEQPSQQLIQSSNDLSDRLNRLQERLKDQMQINEQLLREIDEQKQKIINNLKHSASVGQEVPDVQHPANQIQTQVGDVAPVNKYPYETYTIPVLVIACNRPSAIDRSLKSLINVRPSADQFPIYVSQDCGDQKTADVIQQYGDQVVHMKQPDLSSISLPANQKKFEGYYKIARHYKWALNQMLIEKNFDAVIVVEDDLDVAVDFFEYFLAMYPILKEDKSLYCISAWNDNGRESRIEHNPELLYRSDFFPGLGWMLLRSEWLDLSPKWPAGFWDDWMRHPDQRKGRACIRPEVSRTDTFGKFGVSKGQFFEQHLKFIKLNKDFYPFTTKDLSYLLKQNYDPAFRDRVYRLESKMLSDVEHGRVDRQQAVRITYTDKNSFKRAAKTLGIMQDFKAGVPRTGYMGIVTCVYNGQRVYLAPERNWAGYNIEWS